MSSSNRFREPRKKQARPVKVRAVDEVSRFFSERAETVDISSIGARVVLRHPVGTESPVHLSDVESERSGVFLVVWQKAEGEQYHCGLVLANPAQPLWPPLDQVPDPGGHVDLCCADCGVADHVLLAVREVPFVREGEGLVLPCDHCGKETIWTAAETASAATTATLSASAASPAAEAPRTSRHPEGVFEIQFFDRRAAPPALVAPTERPSVEAEQAIARLEARERELRTAQEKIAELEGALKKAQKESARIGQLETEKERFQEKVEKLQEKVQGRESELKEVTRERDQARKKANTAEDLASQCEELEDQLRKRTAELKAARREQEQLRKQAEAGAANAVRRAELEEIRDKLDAEIAELREQLMTAEAEAQVLARPGAAASAQAADSSPEVSEQLIRAISLLTVARAEAGLLAYAECDDNTRDSVEQINQSLAELAQILAQWQKLYPPRPPSAE